MHVADCERDNRPRFRATADAAEKPSEQAGAGKKLFYTCIQHAAAALIRKRVTVI